MSTTERDESLSRTLTGRPESTTILYAGDSFRVQEAAFIPVNEAGAVILLDVETEQPLGSHRAEYVRPRAESEL